MSSDWEKEDLPTVPVPIKGQWDDEDIDQDDIKDSWDASDSDTQDKPSPTSSATTVPKKKKKALSEKIAERQQEEERKRLEILSVSLHKSVFEIISKRMKLNKKENIVCKNKY